MDPLIGATAISAGSSLLSGIFGGLFGGGPAQIDPAIQAELSAQGIDIERFRANLAAAQLGASLPFAQDVEKYGAGIKAALAEQYTKSWGGVERAAAKMAEMAASGQVSPGMSRFINDYKQSAGRALGTTMENARFNLGGANLDLTSPAAQNMLMEQERQGKLAIEGQAAEMGAQDIAQMRNMVPNLLQWASSTERMAGTQYPELFQTAQEKEAAGLQSEIDRLTQELNNVKPGFLGEFGAKRRRAEIQSRLDQLNARLGQVNSGNMFGTVEHPLENPVRNWQGQDEGTQGYWSGTSGMGGYGNALGGSTSGPGTSTQIAGVNYSYGGKPGSPGYYPAAPSNDARNWAINSLSGRLTQYGLPNDPNRLRDMGFRGTDTQLKGLYDNWYKSVGSQNLGMPSQRKAANEAWLGQNYGRG